MRIRNSLFTLAMIAGAAELAAGGIIKVDPGGSGDFTQLQDAIDAAASGDVLLVTAANYSFAAGFSIGCEVSAKSLTLVADPAGGKFQVSGFNVANLAAGQTVFVRGLEVIGTTFTQFPAGFQSGGVHVTSCTGGTVFEDCDLTGAPAFHLFHGTFFAEPGLRALNAAAVVLSRCNLTGGTGTPSSFPFGGGAADGAAGLVATGSSVALFDSTLTGGVNWPLPANSPVGAGGPGATLAAGKLSSAGCTITGGSTIQEGVGSPGAGLVLASSAAAASLIDSAVAGGIGATGSGAAIVANGGSVQTLSGPARSLEVTSPVHPGDPVTVDLDGMQNDLVLFFVSGKVEFLFVDGLQGALTTALPALGPFVLTAIAAPSGQLSFVAPAPPLVPGVTAFTFELTPIFVNGASAVAGSPTTFTLMQ